MNDYSRRWAAGARALIVHKLAHNGPMTTRQLANACQMGDTAIAPRMTELEAEGLVVDTGERVASVSGLGRKRKLWALSSPGSKRPGMIQRTLPL